ncbi:BamA/TamA family outer membrane protein [Oligoflexia bacterium]|nr:BamA/TamA family outer membrane protein [Oligoflexia bacterium]
MRAILEILLKIGRQLALCLPILLASTAVDLAAEANTGNGANQTDALNGKIIRMIEIEIRDIFERPTNFIYRSANTLKISTRAKVVVRELLFKEGDAYDDFAIRESERNLRTLRYLRDIKISATPAGEYVDLLVSVRDTWTLIPQLSFSSGTGQTRRSGGISESDLFGYGNRLEVLYGEDDQRESIQAVYDSRRVLGTHNELLLGFFDRDDGERTLAALGKPFRSLLQDNAWGSSVDVSDTIGRLFKNGDETYIFRQEETDLSFRYSFARGNPEALTRRYSLGYHYLERTFTQADAKDYDVLELDPAVVSNDAALLAKDRKFSGPTLRLQKVVPDFISMDYIDRFERVADYNLGHDDSLSFFFAPEALGSIDDALIVSSNHSEGIRFNRGSFLRGEVGISARFAHDIFEDTVARTEVNYYNVFGPLYIRDLYLGKHTFASSFYIDYGHDLDADRQLLLGGNNSLRGYKARTFPGDKRFALNLEERIHLVENAFDLISFGAVAFLDVGGATYDNMGDLIADHTYSNIGVGLRFAFPRSSGNRILRFDVAFPLREGPEGSAEFEPRFIFSGGQLFKSHLRSERVGAERASVDIGFDN